MNERSNLYRKLAYVIAIAVLLFPLSRLGSPRTTQDGSGYSLADYRARHGLAQANLGEIDPASETMKLATLGLRGVAVNVLWNKANEFKMKEDWGNLTATLEQLAKLQPNYITFWKYQAWNLSYNVSVEFDDYRDRYYYVRRGVDFLKKGETYNKDNPQLLWELGWFIGQKIGRADEKEQYRRLFRSDDDFHPEDRPAEERDNWLVSKEWYRVAERAAETRGIGRKSPVVFYSSAPKSQMNYATAVGREGRFDRALSGWRLASEEWDAFGNVPLEHSTGVILNLNDEHRLQEQEEAARQELIDLAPDVTGPYIGSLIAKLTDEQRAALEVPEGERDPLQAELARQAEFVLAPLDSEFVDRIVTQRPDLAAEARELGAKLDRIADKSRKTTSYKQTANYDYWALRAEFEQSPEAIAARKLSYQAERAMADDADPVRAADLYAEGLAKWREVFDRFPALWDGEGTTGDDVMEVIIQYADTLSKFDEEIPADFPLWKIVEDFDTDYVLADQLEAHRRRTAEQTPGSDTAETAGDAEPGAADNAQADTGPEQEQSSDTPPVPRGEADAPSDGDEDTERTQINQEAEADEADVQQRSDANGQDAAEEASSGNSNQGDRPSIASEANQPAVTEDPPADRQDTEAAADASSAAGDEDGEPAADESDADADGGAPPPPGS